MELRPDALDSVIHSIVAVSKILTVRIIRVESDSGWSGSLQTYEVDMP